MEQQKWFDRKFDFVNDVSLYPLLLERLEGTSARINQKLQNCSKETLISKQDGKWSIQEHVGHLVDLEPLWLGRLADILHGESHLRPTDLENRATDQAGHNDAEMEDILASFNLARQDMMIKLRQLSEEDLLKTALHPRLEIPMTIMNLFFFVAEHDDHHLAAIHALLQQELETDLNE
ncbi:MAG: DinB family protein [Cytophagales bacterium]|nr:DinB family protein [Cytophagales bacterium]